MSDRRGRAPSNSPRAEDVLRDQVRAWWVSVLAGQVDQSHPTYSDLSATIEGDTLVLRGEVPTEADRGEVEHEVEHLLGQGVDAVRNELVVKPDPKAEEKQGLLSQTFVAAYDGPAAAQFASHYLEEHLQGQSAAIRVITPDDDGGQALAQLLPEEHREDARRLLRDGRSLVVVTVDETSAFAARELLDEDTRSLQTLVLPPRPGDAANADRPRASKGKPKGGAPRRR